MVGRNEHGNEPSGFLKAGKFVNPLSDGQIFKEDPASCKLVLLNTSLVVMNVLLFRLIHTVAQSYMLHLRHISPSFHPCAWNDSAPTRRLFVKFYIGTFIKICR